MTMQEWARMIRVELSQSKWAFISNNYEAEALISRILEGMVREEKERTDHVEKFLIAENEALEIELGDAGQKERSECLKIVVEHRTSAPDGCPPLNTLEQCVVAMTRDQIAAKISERNHDS